MSLTEAHIDLIQRQIAGELKPEMEILFNRYIDGIEGFRDRWIAEKSVLAYVEAQKKLELKQELVNRFLIEAKPNAFRRNWSQMQWASAAAALVIGISALAYFFAFDQPKQPLFYEYYAPYPTQGLVRSDINESSINKVVRLYDTGSYQKFIESLPSAAKEEYPVLSVYAGVAFFELGRADLALGEFSDFENNHPFYAESLWYSALIYLHESELALAIEKLELLIQEGSIYNNDARKLLKDLR